MLQPVATKIHTIPLSKSTTASDAAQTAQPLMGVSP
jgi:hypothetical protein